MALSIRAISKATAVECDGGEDCPDEHFEIGYFPLEAEGLQPGCHVAGKGGRSFSFEIGYSHYARWFDELYRLVFGVDANEVCKDFDRYRGRPFVEFVAIPSTSDGPTIGPITSAKLHADFVAWAAKARKHFTQDEERAWMWDVYRDFRKLFKIASDGGFVSYW
jgi:hypothetical protein